MRTDNQSKLVRIGQQTRWAARWLGAAAAFFGSLIGSSVFAYTSSSPEVKKLVADGLAALEKPADPQLDQYADRLGAKCVAGLAFIKAGKPDHPRVKEAVGACRAAMTAGDTIDVYSNGIAVVFLCELAPKSYQREIQWYLDLLHKRQKVEGGWGYDGNNREQYTYATGDTSQTQYATLGYWSAYRNGFKIDGDSLERVADWLLRTQDPDGCWGYQGRVATGSQHVQQDQKNCSMLAAGLASTLICADLLDAVPAKGFNELEGFADDSGTPSADAPAGSDSGGTEKPKDKKRPPPVKSRPDRISTVDLVAAVDLARGWMKANYSTDVGRYTYYYFYATERYQSFYELVEGVTEEEPRWYNDGCEFLLNHQREKGGWEGGCGLTADTSFAVLFLLRSTQKSIQATLGEGTLVGGRGIPTNVSRAKLRGNQVVVEQVKTRVDEMLSMIDDSDQSKLDELARDPTALVVDKVDEKSARRLQQLVRSAEPEVRLLAVRALGRSGNLDYAPSLIYALTDPDRRIVLEARNNLQFISRRFEGFGPPDDYTDKQRYEAVDAWKKWYRSLRPGSLPDR